MASTRTASGYLVEMAEALLTYEALRLRLYVQA